MKHILKHLNKVSKEHENMTEKIIQIKRQRSDENQGQNTKDPYMIVKLKYSFTWAKRSIQQLLCYEDINNIQTQY